MIDKVFTIGAYGYTSEDFFGRLESHKIDVLIDIRQRRGMRGSTYAFLNSNALQSELAKRDIGYRHMKQMAPTTSIRDAQREADEVSGVTKRGRDRISRVFEERFQSEILGALDIQDICSQIGRYANPCFFCVEKCPQACHRSLVANWLSSHLGASVNDL